MLLPPGQQAPPVLSFTQGWQAEGAYLFPAAAVADADLAAFAAAARTFLADPQRQGARFAWLELEPGQPSRILGATVLRVTGGAAGPVTASDTTFSFRGVSLLLPAGLPIAASDQTSGFAFGGGQAGTPITVTAQQGKAKAGTVTGPAQLGLTGRLNGCLRFQLDLRTEDLDSLGAGVKYFWARPPDPKHPDAPASAFALDSYRYRLFGGPVTVYPVLDPLAVLDASRTYLAFVAADARLAGPGPAAVPCYLRSALNDGYSLVPMADATRPTGPPALVLAIDQQASSASPDDPVYLAPAGDFRLSPAPARPTKLMGGLSGVEYFDLRDQGVIVSFLPGSPAFAAGFVAGRPDVASPLTPATTPVTSFAWIGGTGGAVSYYAQPDQSVLYNYPDAQAGGVSSVVALAPVPVLAASLTAAGARTSAFPLLPYGGADGADLGVLAQLEGQVVSPQRRQKLRAAPPARNAGLPALARSPLSATPQGVLASYVPGGDGSKWSEIVLAQVSAQQRVSLTNVDGQLLGAFQSNKLFLVITDPRAINAYLQAANAQITIGGGTSDSWQFDLAPANWDQHGTVLIVKYHDLSVEDLAASPGAWSAATAFNASPATASQRIIATVRQAKDALAAKDTDYSDFVTAVTDPAWNGIIALSVAAPLDELPAELRGLGAGIDKSKFVAHHVGIKASKIIVPAGGNGPLSIENSSIFGLIDYTAGAPLPPHVADWAFQVSSLKVVFSESAVTSFSAVIDLQVNSLFGEAATLRGDPGQAGPNVVQLFGVYGKHEDNGQVTQSCVFQTKSGQDAAFDLASKALNAVIVSKAQFVTVTSGTSSSGVIAQFLFWGLIDFAELSAGGEAGQPFDALSFGRQQAGDRAGLAFSNLVLRMSSGPAQPAQPPAFTFDASALAFDMTASTPRPHSLFQHLPLTLARLTQAEQGAAPTDLGFMGVQTPLTQSSLSYPWFSLDFNLNLGTLGALAAAAGFVATLTVAWSPGQDSDYHVFVGLKLPGSSGAKRSVPIEGLLDIGFKSLQIVQPEPDVFVLILYGIGFEFLSLTFPPSGQVNFALFGDPNSKDKGDTSLGWYAAYAKPPST